MRATRRFLFRSVTCCGLAYVLAACHSDRRESFYASLADVRKADPSAQSWIPDDLLPGSSRSIHETHESSPSTEWCAFEFLPADSQDLRKHLKKVDALPPSVRRVPGPGVSWWPAVLKGNLDVAKIRGAGFELYVVERPATSVTTDLLLFAINWPEGHAFFYRTDESGSVSAGVVRDRALIRTWPRFGTGFNKRAALAKGMKVQTPFAARRASNASGWELLNRR
jgi:hypothetical protein